MVDLARVGRDDLGVQPRCQLKRQLGLPHRRGASEDHDRWPVSQSFLPRGAGDDRRALLYSEYPLLELWLLPDDQIAPVAIAIDLGGTNSRVAAVTVDGTIIERLSQDTQADAEPEVVVQDLANAVAEVRRRIGPVPIVGLGVAAPGPLNHVTGIVYQTPNLPRWHDVPLAEWLTELTGLPVFLGNDANLAALAEARRGAGRGASNLVYLTVSTGVGSGMLVHGRLLLGEHGAAARGRPHDDLT